MIPASINSQTYFFTINHITKEIPNRHIYGIRLNTGNYFLSKASGLDDCVQLDTNPPLDTSILKQLCDVMTEIELKHAKRPSLEQINNEIFKILARIRTPLFR